MTQTDTLVRLLRDHPGATSLEITKATDLVNVTGRVSDARAAGWTIDCRSEKVGKKVRHRYWLTDKPEQLTAFS